MREGSIFLLRSRVASKNSREWNVRRRSDASHWAARVEVRLELGERQVRAVQLVDHDGAADAIEVDDGEALLEGGELLGGQVQGGLGHGRNSTAAGPPNAR